FALKLAGLIHPYARIALAVFWCWQIFAARTLAKEARMVGEEVRAGDLAAARLQVGRIVGRDTGGLSMTEVIKACIETVAESASDGVIAPLLFIAVGGVPLGFLYKAINTLDSMVGYKNDRYRYFGTASARLDDVANFIPARLTALLMILTAPFVGLDGRNAFRMWKRDRLKHLSPNSGNPESACAGALNVQLGGDAFYFGKLYKKNTLGDPNREVEAEDIPKAVRLMYAASWAALILAAFIRIIL
ncbi:MAG: adenosylcobinamide-phosphate synthase CbiB, partial [Clostridia bacterium]|nr:adenosylcobinamide-phosphate synthase CbiB [Clostridia bacterium]